MDAIVHESHGKTEKKIFWGGGVGVTVCLVCESKFGLLLKQLEITGHLCNLIGSQRYYLFRAQRVANS